MTPATTCKRGADYRYHACVKTKKSGAEACPVRSAPAGELERFVIDHVRELSREPALVIDAIAQAKASVRDTAPALREEERTLTIEHERVRDQARKLLSVLANQTLGDGGFASERLGELDDQAKRVERRLGEVREERVRVARTVIDEDEARAALSLFDPVWDVLEPKEQARILGLLIERVEFDGVKGEIGITLYPLGVKTLAEEVAAADRTASTDGDCVAAEART